MPTSWIMAALAAGQLKKSFLEQHGADVRRVCALLAKCSRQLWMRRDTACATVNAWNPMNTNKRQIRSGVFSEHCPIGQAIWSETSRRLREDPADCAGSSLSDSYTERWALVTAVAALLFSRASVQSASVIEFNPAKVPGPASI